MEKEKILQNRSDKDVRRRFFTVSSNFIAAIGFFSFIGYQLDKKLETDSYFITLGGILLGFAWGMYETIKTVLWLNRKLK